MTETPSPPPAPAGAPPPLPMKTIGAAVGGVLVVVVAAVAILRSPATTDPVAPLPDGQMPEVSTTIGKAYGKKEPLEVASVGEPSLWLDVHKPLALKAFLTENAWLTATAKEPLGRGFLGGWSGFLGSDGKDIGLAKMTQGLVADLIADQILVQPMRVVWFSGWGGAAPAIVVQEPEAALLTSFQGIKAAVERGGHVVDGCPGDAAPPQPPATDDAGVPPTPNPNELHVSRLVVADQSLFAAHHRGRLVFAKDVQSVVNGLCAKDSLQPSAAPVEGADVTLAMAPEKFGRDAHALFGLVGLDGSPRLALRAQGGALVPVGIVGTLKHPGRVEASALPKDTWRLVPEDAPVALAVNLALPEELSAPALGAFYEGKGEKTRARHALVVWQPHGDAKAPTDVAIIWSDVKDEAALRAMFSGPNKLETRVVCNRVVLSSTPSLLSRVEAACAGTSPSLVFASPAVVSGLTEPLSVGLTVDVGRLLAGLLDDGWRDLAPPKKGNDPAPTPPEIGAATKRLRELPRLGFIGTKSGGALAPRGFSS